MEIAKKFIPTLKRPIFKRENYTYFFEIYWFKTIIITCCSSIALFLPAYLIKFGYDNGIVAFYILAILLAVPWFLIPTLFLLYLANGSKPAIIAAYSFIGVLTVVFLTWVICIFQY
ncbi:hypothetical protein [Sutcliffiella halmapala]|uniref:hypothetical protein n=1 Tax=Sutcliffiella halmapala TaxID=79882 RepID=UPI0009956E1C|nr:hypothetical protein [Sutcliffiella halmapala]